MNHMAGDVGEPKRTTTPVMTHPRFYKGSWVVVHQKPTWLPRDQHRALFGESKSDDDSASEVAPEHEEGPLLDDAEGDLKKAARFFRDTLLDKPFEELSHEMRAKVDEAEMLLIKRGDYVLRKRRKIDVDKDHDKLTDVTFVNPAAADSSGFQNSQDTMEEQSQPDENEVRVVET